MSVLRSKPLLAALVLAVVFGFGVVKLFLLRFEAGDVYPPYSSMRSDPLGTQALYDGLNQMAEGTARRHFRPLDKLVFAPGRTILLCGLSEGLAWRMRSRSWEKMMSAIEQNGGRLVMALRATSQRLDEKKDPADDELENGPPEEDEEETSPEGANETEDWQGLDELGVSIERAGGPETQAPAIRSDLDVSSSLPSMLPWHGALFFDFLEDEWQVLYRLDGHAVMAERAWGRGTVVMVASSYLFSNEALRRDRHADLLAWLLVPGHEVIFDESHLGLARHPGIASLALKYRLQGVVAVVVLVAILLIWRQTALFVPVTPSGDGEAADLPLTLGRDTAEGLAHLLRQHIAAEEALMVCHDCWIHSAAVNTIPEEKIAGVEQILKRYRQAPRANNPIDVYRTICQMLKQGQIL